MSNKLPARPNLEHLRGQAKDLLSRFKSGDSAAIEEFAAHLPSLSGLPLDQVRTAELSLGDGQSAVARKYGFSSWLKLTRHVEMLRKIEGTWTFTSLEVDGNAMPTIAFDSSSLVLDANNFGMKSPMDSYEGWYEINVDEAPFKIDIHFTEDPEKGNSSFGIFECDGREFKICLGFTGIPRPTEFATTAGSGLALETLRRGSARQIVESVLPTAEEVSVSDEGFGEMSPGLEKLQGDWVPVSLIRDGMPLPQNYLGFGLRTMTGAETLVTFGGQIQVRALTKIDESVNPITVDYLISEGSANGKLQLGIMEWEGTNAKFCFAPIGKPRPTEFTASPESGNTLAIWEPK